METIKITTDNKIAIINLDFKSYKAIQKEIGGHFETVKTKRLLDYFKAPVIMLVDEEGIIKGLPFNAVASGFYGTDEHGQPIVGDAILCLALGEDITGLGDRDSEQWMNKMLKDFQGLQRNDA